MRQNNPNDIPDNIWDRIINDPDVRRAVTKENHLLFFYVFFPHYVKHGIAPFQKELFAITEDETIKTAVIEAFRNSAKTTIIGLSYSIWAILGRQQKKFIIILAQTQQQARQYLTNIKDELEANSRLKADLGPFEEPDDEWRSVSIVLPKYGARITVASVDQTIRGLRHGPHRPDLIICDDLEDLSSVRQRDMRNKLYDWLTGDIVPLGDKDTRLIVIGTRLHDDSLVMRLKKSIEEGKINGIFRSYPFIDRDGKVAWESKFPTPESIEEEKRKIGDDRAWRREYLLEIVGDMDQIIAASWIQHYDVLLPEENCRMTVVAIDPAISERDTADCTAMVAAKVYGYGKDAKIYILPNPVNERLSFPQAVECAKKLVAALGDSVQVFIEDIAYQRAFPQTLEQEGIRAEAVPIGGQDKRARLNLTTHLIQQGRILFPIHGAEDLIEQLVGFGVERYDDLVDAFTLLVLRLLQDMNHAEPSIRWLGCDDCDNGTHGQGWRPLSW